MTEWLGVDEVIQRFPLGDEVEGRIGQSIAPAGVFVDLGLGTYAFVDGEHLCAPANWPPAGTVARFEVLRHDVLRSVRRCQVRLWPLEQRWRNPRASRAFDAEEWAAIKARHPVGTSVAGTVGSVSEGNRWYTVRFGDVWARVTWTGVPPLTGTTGRYTVTRLLDSTRRIQITPS